MRFDTTWSALVKVSTVESRPFYYREEEDYYELIMIISPVLFYAKLNKSDSDAKTFDADYKSNAIKLN